MELTRATAYQPNNPKLVSLEQPNVNQHEAVLYLRKGARHGRHHGGGTAGSQVQRGDLVPGAVTATKCPDL